MKPERRAGGHRQAPQADEDARHVKRAKREKRKKDHIEEREPKKSRRQKRQDRFSRSSPNASICDSRSTSSYSGNRSRNKKAEQQQQQRTTVALRSDRAPPELDPLLLARGMSSRCLSSKVSHQLTSLPKDTIDKDLCHMKAYSNACKSYDQQLFMSENQDIVKSGFFGTFAPFPGADGNIVRPNFAASSSAASASASLGPSKSSFALPITIDPEEGKRAALLRKRLPRAEFEREQLETEYLSLRAHYVHETQLTRKTREYEISRWQLLQELLARRGRVLGLLRAQVAMGRDVEKSLRCRGGVAKARNSVRGSSAVKNAKIAANGATKKSDNQSGVAALATEAETSKEAVDLRKIWNSINTDLRDAEAACTEIETPEVLSTMVMGPPTTTMLSNSGSSVGGRSRSPTKAARAESTNSTNNNNSNSNSNNDDVNDSSSNNDNKSSSSVDRAGSNKNAAESEKHSNSAAPVLEETDATSNNNESNKGNGNGYNNIIIDSKKSSIKKGNSKGPIPPGLESYVVPWDCMVDPSTPFELPLIFSCLSSATDKAVGYASGNTSRNTVTWLESALPVSTIACATDGDDLARLREEVRGLEEELGCESARNTELQKQVVSSRSKSNKMVAMMQVLRSEMQTVLERHNTIMETPEARSRAKSVQLHKKLMKQKNRKKASTKEGKGGEGKEGRDSKKSENDGDEDEDRSEEDSVVTKETAMRNSNNDTGEEESDMEEDDASEYGEIVGKSQKKVFGEKEKAPRKSKRRHMANKESSSLKRLRNTNSYRRTRR